MLTLGLEVKWLVEYVSTPRYKMARDQSSSFNDTNCPPELSDFVN